MKAMILAAGTGKRLLPLTASTPKTLLPVEGRPLIEHVLQALVTAGITDIVINLRHLGERIAAHLGDGARFGARICYSRETEVLETGGGIAHALPLLGAEPFLIANGDIFTDFDFRTLPALKEDDLAHLVLTPRPDWRTAGDFEYDAGRVVARGDSHVYCGIAIVNPALFTDLPPAPFSWNLLMFRALAAGRLSAQVHRGRWLDIGTPEQYAGVIAGRD